MPSIEIATDSRGVTTVTLNRPDKHNALDGESWRQLYEALTSLRNDPAVRAVVLTGAGQTFCAGADISHMRSMLNASEQQNVEDAMLLARCLRALDELPQPVIARINGNAFGGGVGLIACADIAIASEAAKFALTEVRLGLVPATISPYVIDAIGPRQARRLFLTAATLDATEAQALNLVHVVVPADALDATVAQQLDLLLRGGPMALEAAKKLIRDVSRDTTRDSAEADRAQLLAKLRVSAEGREGLSAFLERRKPDWS